MIDIGLSQIALIGVVALVVVGPQRLPGLARMGGTLFGRAQRYINEIKSEVSREIELDQLRALKKDVQEAADSVQQSLTENASMLQQELAAATQGANHFVSDAASHSSMPESFSTAPERLALTPEWVGRKAKNFRQKKLARTSAIPSWYKRQGGSRTCASSGAARAARCRPGSTAGQFFR